MSSSIATAGSGRAEQPYRCSRLVEVCGLTGAVALLVFPALLGSISSVIALLCALALVPALRQKDWRGTLSHQPAAAIFLVVFVALAAVFVATARAPGDALYVANFLGLLLVLPVAIVAEGRRGPRFALLLCILCLAGAAMGVLTGVFDMTIRHLDRATGLVGNSNLLPRVAVLLGFCALGGVFLTTARWRVVFYLGPLFSVVAVYLAQSRGAAIALPVLALIAFIFVGLKRSTRWHVIPLGLGALATAAVLGAILWAGNLEAPRSIRFLGLGNIIADVLGTGDSRDASTEERLTMYRAGGAAFLASPWIGYGWANVGTAAATADPEILSMSASSPAMLHNDLMNFAVAGGGVGLACWLGLLLSPLAGGLRSPPDSFTLVRWYFAIVLTIGTAIAGATDLVLGYDLHTTMFAFMTVGLLTGAREPQVPPNEPEHP